jgi:iron-sulfur cluster assembly protein
MTPAPAAEPTAAPVQLTERAATMVLAAMREEGLSGHGLRVGVMGGGCSGLQYLLDFAAAPLEDDRVAEQFGVRLFVDPYSANHLQGTVIDYVDDAHGAGFHFANPNVSHGCACSSGGSGCGSA